MLLLNAACAVLALAGLLVFGPLAAPLAPTAAADATRADAEAWRRGGELGLWKFLGATANLYGLSLTSSDHGAFLIQLTTLIVPLVQGLRGVPIPPRIWAAVVLALTGVFVFTLDPPPPRPPRRSKAMPSACWPPYSTRPTTCGSSNTGRAWHH